MNKLKLLLVIYLGATLVAAAQTPSTILKQAEKAMGGEKTLRRAVAWRKSGAITRERDGATGKIVMQFARPDLYNIQFDVGGFEIESGYNGRSGWIRDSREGLRTLTGDASADFKAEAAFRSSLWLDARREKARFVSGGKANVNGRPANVVVLNTAKGGSIKLFFDSATKLLAREEFPSADGVRSFEYSDYRPIDGVAQAQRMKFEIDGERYAVIFDEITSNGSLARSEFDFPKLSAEPLPDIPSLLKEVQSNEDNVEKILDTYSFVQKYTRRELGKDGVLRETGSETYQLSFYKGRRIARMIEKNGKTLSPSDQADQDKQTAKRIEEIDKEIAEHEKKGNTEDAPDDNRRISIAELLRASKLLNPRRERFRGRDVIVFDFEPDPTFDYKNARSMLRFFGKTAGAMWIDEKDKQVARIEAFLADSFKIGGGMVAKLRKGASFTLEQQRVNDEIWLPSTADINLSVRVFLVKGIDLNQVVRAYDYRKFTTEVKDATVGSPVNPQ